ncbi:MAG: methylenetetrahydrofolate reductase [Acholeplasmatales bacterium]|nr:methylenetetrahydrofolate reductase [Acholeplasmatales bacterium]
MKIDEILKNKRTLSFETFPPKYGDTESLDKTYNVLDELSKFEPDFISVTYGAGGTNSKDNIEIASYIKNKLHIESLAHLTGGPSTYEDIDRVIGELKKNNIENILALRGDKPIYYTEEYCKTFKHATDLMEYINKEGFTLSGACYPEGHIEAKSLYDDLVYMKKKEECGAKFFITQVFYDNNYYYRLVNEARKIGIKSPIIPGVMPLTSPKSISKIKSMCGSTIPLDYLNMIEVYQDNPRAFRELGYNYTVYQIMDLIAKGAPGIHLYVMNNVNTAKEILERIPNVIKEFFKNK